MFHICLLFPKISEIPEEYIIFEKANIGYDLYIKKTPDINSILLTESQKDPLEKKTNYGLRTPKFHPCNGNEKGRSESPAVTDAWDRRPASAD